MTTTTGPTAYELLTALQGTDPDLIKEVIVCTHTEATREHLDVCCADGVDCDNCGQPIDGLHGYMLATDEPGAICRDCGLDALDRFES